MTEDRPPYDPSAPRREAAVTLPLDALELVVGVAQRFHPGNLKPLEREALAPVVGEVEAVRKMVGVG